MLGRARSVVCGGLLGGGVVVVTAIASASASGRRAIFERPGPVNYALRSIGEKGEKTWSKIEPAVGATRARVHDGGRRCLAIVGHGDLLVAIRAGVRESKGLLVQGNDKVRVGVVLTASTESSFVEGPSRAGCP